MPSNTWIFSGLTKQAQVDKCGQRERKKGVKSCKSQSGSGSALEAKMDTQLACLTRSEGPSKGRSQSPQPAFLLKPTTAPSTTC